MNIGLAVRISAVAMRLQRESWWDPQEMGTELVGKAAKGILCRGGSETEGLALKD